MVESSKNPCFYNTIETRDFSRGLRGLRGNFKKQNTNNIIEKCWKMSENAEEPSQKRQRFANMESEDLNSLLDMAQAQSTKYNTA